jgi:hypothetical protein
MSDVITYEFVVTEEAPVAVAVEEANTPTVVLAEDGAPVILEAGVAGPQGIQGEKGLQFMGEFDPTATYPRDALVLHNGALYIALDETTGIAPPLGLWAFFLSGGTGGDGGMGYIDEPRYVECYFTESDTWEINHGLQAYPRILLLDSDGYVISAQINYVDENNVKVTFNSPQTGWAIVFHHRYLKRYELYNATPSDAWEATHDLQDTVPVVLIKNGDGDVIVGDIVYDSNANRVDADFNVEVDGYMGVFSYKDFGRKTYEFSDPSTTWVATHNLGGYPYPVIVGYDGHIMQGSIRYASPNVIEVYFNKPAMGRLYLL